MAFSKIKSAGLNGLIAYSVFVEADISVGLFSFYISGLPDKAVGESRDRIISAIKNSGCKSPKTLGHKIIISLAPADIKKSGTYYDLPISVAYLLATKEIEFNPIDKFFIGELSLNGELRSVRGSIPLILHAIKSGIKEIYFPSENLAEVSLLLDENLKVKFYPVKYLQDIIHHFSNSGHKIKELIYKEPSWNNGKLHKDDRLCEKINHIIGQEKAKRAIEICCAGGHNLVLVGTPGTGKSLLAEAAGDLLPNMSREEALDTISIKSLAGNYISGSEDLFKPPFRSPHHTASLSSIIGGNGLEKPGEITLAHNGILFFDELPEFEARVIETLREPLEKGKIKISRANYQAEMPADFIFLGAMNPCPCGYLNSSKKICSCSASNLNRYKKKISGPITDRIELWVETKENISNIKDTNGTSNTKINIRNNIEKAREKQKARFYELGLKIKLNKDIPFNKINEISMLSKSAERILNSAVEKLSISMRTKHKLIRVARTIADLDNNEGVLEKHILESLQYRPTFFDTN